MIDRIPLNHELRLTHHDRPHLLKPQALANPSFLKLFLPSVQSQQQKAANTRRVSLTQTVGYAPPLHQERLCDHPHSSRIRHNDLEGQVPFMLSGWPGWQWLQLIKCLSVFVFSVLVATLWPGAFISNHHITFLLSLSLPFFCCLHSLCTFLSVLWCFLGWHFSLGSLPFCSICQMPQGFLSRVLGRTRLLKPSGEKLLFLFSPLLCSIPQWPLSGLCHQGFNSNQLSSWSVLPCRQGHLSHVNLSNFFLLFFFKSICIMYLFILCMQVVCLYAWLYARRGH